MVAASRTIDSSAKSRTIYRGILYDREDGEFLLQQMLHMALIVSDTVVQFSKLGIVPSLYATHQIARDAADTLKRCWKYLKNDRYAEIRHKLEQVAARDGA